MIRKFSVRTRLTVLFVGVLSIMFLVINLLTNAATANSAISHANDKISSELARVADSDATRITAHSGLVTLNADANLVVQVVDFANRTVWASSSNAVDLRPIAHFRADSAAPNGLIVSTNPWVASSYLSGQVSLGRALVISTPRGPAVAYAYYLGHPLEGGGGALRQTLLLRLPLAVLLISVLVWLAVGRALRPVEVIRRRVATIATSDLSERIPVPPGDDVVARTARTLNDMLSRLESNTRSQQEFLSNASHELRSPLTTLLATIDRATAAPERADWLDVSGTIRREGFRLNALIDDLFWLARNDEGAIELRREDVDVDDILEEEARRIRVMSSLIIDTSQVDPVRVWGDPGMLRRMVRNVTENASRFARTYVRMTAKYDVGDVIIQIHNDGDAVDVATSHLLFQRFARADSSRSRASGGTGLGLTIVADIASRHGGTAPLYTLT